MRTPAPAVDVLAAFPELRPLGRTATRLHPRPAQVRAGDSHVGGPLLWPADEPWPVCTDVHMGMTDVPLPQELLAELREAEKQREQRHVMAPAELPLLREIERIVGPGYTGYGSLGDGPVVGHRWGPMTPDGPTPLVALAQLFAADVPDLPRPGGADLLQVLWCPFEHRLDGLTGPAVTLRWRLRAQVGEILAEPPRGAVGDEIYVPDRCRLHPEQITEYPHPDELPEGLRQAVDDWEHDYVGLVLAPGWKVGGHAGWSLTDLLPTPCPRCDGPTGLLLTIDSKEFDGGTYEQWRPVEERHIDWGHPDRRMTQEPTGVTVGRWGSLRIFLCQACPETPFLLDMQ